MNWNTIVIIVIYVKTSHYMYYVEKNSIVSWRYVSYMYFTYIICEKSQVERKTWGTKLQHHNVLELLGWGPFISPWVLALWPLKTILKCWNFSFYYWKLLKFIKNSQSLLNFELNWNLSMNPTLLKKELLEKTFMCSYSRILSPKLGAKRPIWIQS